MISDYIHPFVQAQRLKGIQRVVQQRLFPRPSVPRCPLLLQEWVSQRPCVSLVRGAAVRRGGHPHHPLPHPPPSAAGRRRRPHPLGASAAAAGLWVLVYHSDRLHSVLDHCSGAGRATGPSIRCVGRNHLLPVLQVRGAGGAGNTALCCLAAVSLRSQLAGPDQLPLTAGRSPLPCPAPCPPAVQHFDGALLAGALRLPGRPGRQCAGAGAVGLAPPVCRRYPGGQAMMRFHQAHTQPHEVLAPVVVN